MSIPRFLCPRAPSASALSKFASSYSGAASASSTFCCRAPRNIYSPSSRNLSSKRQLQTASVYRPQTLDSNGPIPARNIGVPDTSIAGGVPEVNETRPSKSTAAYDGTFKGSSELRSSVIVAEEKVQHSRTTSTNKSDSKVSTLQNEVPSSEAPKARSKLRPRKAAMTLTSRATDQLRQLLRQPQPRLIRVGVKNRGCSGLAYSLEYVEKAGAFDETVEQDGVKVLIDSKALFSIIGSEMDWVEDKLNKRFVFRNPNIKEQCGCGESFMV
ncbi:MAG: hypothetical protein M1825_001177 [Sarcosagium campestre]|nr:MAG: hypothetical protein M1825_001177 [Sarcosagium campestre]